MGTYFCKCGKAFTKSTNSETTGYRMPDYGPDHECYGCHFVIPILKGWPDPVIATYECRGSKSIRYETRCKIGISDKDFSVSHIYTLDIDFAKKATELFNSLDGIEGPQKTDFICRPSENENDGLIDFVFLFQHNKKGTAAKRIFYEALFLDSKRLDVKAYQEKQIVLQQIWNSIKNHKTSIESCHIDQLQENKTELDIKEAEPFKFSDTSEIFSIRARRCKRCGGLLTSKQAVQDGYGHTCKMKVNGVLNAQRPLDGQISFNGLIDSNKTKEE